MIQDSVAIKCFLVKAFEEGNLGSVCKISRLVLHGHKMGGLIWGFESVLGNLICK